jgi:hypothetical protein
MNAAGNEGARRESDGQGTRLAFSRSYAELVSGKSAEQHRRTPYIAPLRRGVGTLAWDSPVLPYAPKFLELRHSEVHMAPSARSGGAYNVLWMFSVSYVRQLPCVCILNLRNAQSQVISPTHIWATARYKQATARGLISPLRKASGRGYRGIKWSERQSWGPYAGFLQPYRRARRPGPTTILAPFP